MAMRFMNGLTGIINSLNNPHGLKTMVETLGFQHLDLAPWQSFASAWSITKSEFLLA